MPLAAHCDRRYENEKNLLKSAKSLNLDLVEDRKRLEELQVRAMR